MDSNESIAVKHYYIKNIIHQPPMSYSPTSICDHLVVAGIYIKKPVVLYCVLIST